MHRLHACLPLDVHRFRGASSLAGISLKATGKADWLRGVYKHLEVKELHELSVGKSEDYFDNDKLFSALLGVDAGGVGRSGV
jgi:hypothetical protein